MPARADVIPEELADARRALALAEADAAELLDLRDLVRELRGAITGVGSSEADRAYGLAARLAEVEVERDALRERLEVVSADRDDAARVLALRDEELAGWRTRAAQSPGALVRSRARGLLRRS